MYNFVLKIICVKFQKNNSKLDFIQKDTVLSVKFRMQKNVLACVVLLTIISYVSMKVSVSHNDADDDLSELTVEDLKIYFDHIEKVGRTLINHKVRRLLPTLTTLPAAVPDKSLDIFKAFTKMIIETAGDIMEDNVNLKVNQYLFTRENPKEKYNMKLSFDSFLKASFDPSLETKVLIHNFRESLPKSSIYYEIKDKLLEVGNYNVFVIDWTYYSYNDFEATGQNAFFIGVQLTKFFHSLVNYYRLDTASIHIIAHGMGCHVAATIGKMFGNGEIGRITGLDATGYLYDDLPDVLKLTQSDANFVDAIHTHGSSSYSEGIGTIYVYGHIDFFPNGGSVQPGCRFGGKYTNKDKKTVMINDGIDLIMCNHERALFLFLESISDCPFVAVNCGTYADFILGNCPLTETSVANMGFHAKPPAPEAVHPFYILFTGAAYPFCRS